MRIVLIVLTLLGSLSVIKGQTPEYRDYMIIEGHKFTVSEEKVVFTKDSVDYINLKGKTYKLEYFKKLLPGPKPFMFFVRDDKGEIISLDPSLRVFKKTSSTSLKSGDKLEKALPPNTRRIKSFAPDKPFIWYYPEGKERDPRKLYSVYREPSGRIIPEREFQSYRGNFKFHRRINGKSEVLDTVVISPPDAVMKNAEAKRLEQFHGIIGNPLPDATYTDLDGNSYDRATVEGKVVVLNFWFIGCPPCIKEIPQLNELKKKYEGKDVIFLALSTDSETRLKRFLERKEFDYQVIPEALEIAQEQYNVYLYPSHFIADKTGIVRFAHEGYTEGLLAEMTQTIDKLLEKE